MRSALHVVRELLGDHLPYLPELPARGPGGDMIDNLLRRLSQVASLDPIAGPILEEVARRVQRADTVIRRLGGEIR